MTERTPRTRRGAFAAAGLLALALPLAGCGGKGPAYGPPPRDVAAVVTMTNAFSFAPAVVQVPAGSTIEWRNTSIATHTVTDAPRLAPKLAGSMALPAGAAPFHSSDIPPGQVYRATFATPGTYRYICVPHHGMFGMEGTVEVTP
jgi:plastocyanin